MIELFDALNLSKYNEHSLVTREMANNSDGKVTMWTQYHFDYGWICEQLLKYFGDLTGKKILDAGCGTSVLQFYLKKLGADIYSCDINDYSERLKSYDSEVKFTQCNFSDERELIPFEDNFFDAIISVSVLEHMLPYHAQWSCFNFGKLVKTNGIVLITTDLYAYRMYTPKHIVFCQSDIYELFCNDDLKLLNKDHNFNDCEQLHFRMCSLFAINKTVPLLCVPGGIVLIKHGTS